MKKTNGGLKRMVLCGLLAVTAMGACVNVEAAVAKENFSTSTTSTKDWSITVDKESKGTHYTGAQFYKHSTKGTSANTNVRLKKNIDVKTNNAATDTNSISSAVYAYAAKSSETFRLNVYLGSADTDHVNLTATGGNHVMGIYMYNSWNTITPTAIPVNGAYMEVAGKNLNIDATTTSETGYAHGIYVGNNTTTLNEKETTKLVINSENTVINAHSSVKDHEKSMDGKGGWHCYNSNCN